MSSNDDHPSLQSSYTESESEGRSEFSMVSSWSSGCTSSKSIGGSDMDGRPELFMASSWGTEFTSSRPIGGSDTGESELVNVSSWWNSGYTSSVPAGRPSWLLALLLRVGAGEGDPERDRL